MEQLKKEKKEIIYPQKPKRNPEMEKNEKKCRVICNLRQITLDSQQHRITQYAIHFEPEIPEDNFPKKKKIIRLLKTELHKHFQKFIQGGDTLFVCGENLQEKISLETNMDGSLYKATFIKTQNFIDCRNINTKSRDHIKIKNLIETLLKNILYSNNHIVKFDDRSFYDWKDVENFGQDKKGSIWHGYSTAICITENGLFLRINDKNKMITGKTAYEKITQFSQKYGGNILDENCLRDIKDYFIGKTVVSNYGNFRAYRIGDVLFDKTVNNTNINYVDVDGKTTTITLKNYYANQYGLKIKHDNQPLFIDEDSTKAEENRKRYLLPEYLNLTGIDEVEERDKAEIIAKSKFPPSVKMKKIEKGMTYLTNTEKRKLTRNKNTIELPSPNEIREEWGINFGDRFVEVDARTLALPDIEFGGIRPEKPQINHGRFRQKRDAEPINFDSTNCTLITFNNIVGLAKGDCEQFCKACNAFGITFKFPELIKLNHTRKEDLLGELKNIQLKEGKKIVIVVLDKATKNLYPLIKDYLYTERGITSQFMLHDENPKGGRKKQNMSYYSGVLNQMVVKASGELFRIHFCDGIDSGPSMIIGLDSSRTKDGNKYVLSASYNRKFNRFYTDFANAKNSPEDHTLCNLFGNALNYFRNINRNNLPKTLIVYRTGGNDKQVEKIMRNELQKLLDFLSGDENNSPYEKGYKPKLSFFTVNKKTDLKFFQKNTNGYSNISMGTVIDQEVISPEAFEFYLQCPDVDRGCASPVHFLCIYNDNEKLTINDFEDISFKQSFYYWNWPGPVRIPAALKYAEVANTFSSKNLTHEVKAELKNSPYYI